MIGPMLAHAGSTLPWAGPLPGPVGPMLAHAGHGGGTGWSVAFPVGLGLAVLYVAAAARARPGWPRSRTARWLAGCGVLAVAGAPLVGPLGDARAHVLAHLLVGMVAPIGLVLGAPVTLLLRVCPPPRRRAIVGVLRSAPARALSHPVTGLVLSVGGLWMVMLSPLYAAGPVPHQALLVHYLAAGTLLTWALVGTDPSPHRAGLPMRVGVLAAAAAGHAVLAKYAYASAERMAGELATDAQTLERAAMLMYYGADLADLALAVILFSSWYAHRGRRFARTRPATVRNPTSVTF
jgi:putative membrane protein